MSIAWVPMAESADELFRAYLLTTGHTPATTKSYIASIRLFYKWCAGHETDPLYARASDVDGYLAYLLDRVEAGTLAHNTVPLRLAHLRTFYKFCIRQHWRRSNPAEDQRIKWLDVPPRTPLRADEIKLLLEACRNARDRLMIILAYDCGLRVAEVVGIHASHIHFEEGAIFVQGKGGKIRWVIPSPSVMAALKSFVDLTGDHLWLTRDGRPLSVKRAQRNMETIAGRAGIHVHWHKLRTTFANDCLAKGIRLEHLQEMMGHADLKTTRHYAGHTIRNQALMVMRQLHLAESLDIPTENEEIAAS